MPVYRQTYQQYTGQYRPHSVSWTVIAWKGITRAWQHKFFKVLRVFFIFGFLFYTIWIYLATNLELLQQLNIDTRQINRIIEINEKFYYRFLISQLLFFYIITLILCPSLVAEDRRTKALVLYLSKSITRFDYLFGKGVVVLFYLSIVTIVASYLLMFLYALFSDNFMYLVQNLRLAFQIFLFSAAMIVPLVFLNLAVSSVSHSRITVSGVLCCIYFMAPVISQVLSNIFSSNETYLSESGPLAAKVSYLISHYEWWSLLSLSSIWTQLGNVIFHEGPAFELHWGWHASVLVLICLASTWVLHRQIRAVEVVK